MGLRNDDAIRPRTHPADDAFPAELHNRKVPRSVLRVCRRAGNVPQMKVGSDPPRYEKCEGEGERGLAKVRTNMERKDWTLEKGYREDGITTKFTYDHETNAYIFFGEGMAIKL
ncbi:unnamed protein product [Darwinula stevensoni]|uniref:Uncharacterized protein n=1 Tax=Darwinula stevensoni TaxID=69355 RepID=A0A7R9FQY7_9CRUS|nr:unnamed protein product [Darwinula stevensoni]CAG0900395.1 unnamed protein product [Darwinula stevensoni]